MEGKGVTSMEGLGSPGPVHPERITAQSAITPSAEIAARDGFMHVSFDSGRLNLVLSAGNFGVIAGEEACNVQTFFSPAAKHQE